MVAYTDFDIAFILANGYSACLFSVDSSHFIYLLCKNHATRGILSTGCGILSMQATAARDTCELR